MGDEMLNTVKAIKTALGGESGGETYGSELLNTVIDIKELVENGGGGGGGLPSYTSADKGKFLGLGEGEGSVTAVIVPEQSVTSVGVSPDPVLLSNADGFSSLTVGTSCVLTVNGVDANVTVTEEDGMLYVESGSYIIVYAEDPEAPYQGVRFSADAGTYTVSLTRSVPSVEPKWENVGVVVNLTFQNTSEGVIINHYTSSKTYAQILSLVSSGVPVTVRYSVLNDSGTELPATVEYVPFSAVVPGQYVQFCKCSPELIDDTSITINYRTIYYLVQSVPDLAPEAIYTETFEVTSTID